MRESDSALQNNIIADETSVQNTAVSENVTGESIKTGPKKKFPDETLKDYSNFQSKLRNHFNVKVEVTRNNNGAGKIVIPFNSDDELSRIINILESKE